jgi:hypothetical protein
VATSTITGTITDPIGTAVSGALVVCRLMSTGGFRTADGSEVARNVSTTTNGSGVYTFVLERNSGISPTNSYYEITEYIPAANGGPKVWNISVGASNQTVYAALVTPMPAGVPTYLTQASADARYQALSAIGTDTPTTIQPDDAAAAGASTAASRGDHKHAIVGAVAGAIQPDDAAAEGVATSFARSDHKHSIVAVAPVATGDANTEGVATSFARSDHVHKGVVAADAWTSYTPTLTQAATVTKTVTYAKYVQIGKTVIGSVFLTVTGAGTAANAVKLGLPVTAATATSLVIGPGYIFDTSAGFLYTAIGTLASTTDVQFLSLVNGAASQVLGSASFTAALAVGDLVLLNFSYEAA